MKVESWITRYGCISIADTDGVDVSTCQAQGICSAAENVRQKIADLQNGEKNAVQQGTAGIRATLNLYIGQGCMHSDLFDQQSQLRQLENP